MRGLPDAGVRAPERRPAQLACHGVGVAYDGAVAVTGVDLCVEPGEWVGIIGPNGAGKSSLLRAVAGLVPHSGTVTVDGAPPARGRRRAQQIALVPQTPVTPPGVTVIDYVLLGRTPHIPYLGVERGHDLAVVEGVLDRLDLHDFADRRVETLSGGERQRVVIARALAQQAPVLLLDEPTAGLDVGIQQQVLELVAGLCATEGLTVLSAMHDLTLAGQFADRLALLSGRRMAAVGPAEEVLTEGAIGRHYGAHVRVVRDAEGTVIVIPMRQPTQRRGGADDVGHLEGPGHDDDLADRRVPPAGGAPA
jgi:iron complex transport system ATP-binding protein